MTIEEDIKNLNNYFAVLIEANTKYTDGYNKVQDICGCWERIKISHADGELLAITVAPIIDGFTQILQAYHVVRQLPESEDNANH